MKKLAVALLLIFMIAAVGCGSDSNEDEILVPIYEVDKIEYKTETVEIGDISQKYTVEGSFDFPYSENVYFKMSGNISTIEVEDGAQVKEGDVLCTLNSDNLDRQLDEKLVYLEQAEKTVNTLKSTAGSSKTELELAQTELEIQQLEYEHLEQSLDDYKVYAPCDGIFRLDTFSAFGSGIDDQRGAENLIVAGASVNSGQVLGTVSDHSQRYIVCDVYDITLENVNFGTRVSITQGVTQAQGKVVDTISTADGGMNCTRYIILPDEGSDLSDLAVVCEFSVYSKIDVVLVPTSAIKTTKDRTYVNLLIDGTKIEQDVEIGIEDGELTEILSGLSGGESVIIN